MPCFLNRKVVAGKRNCSVWIRIEERIVELMSLRWNYGAPAVTTTSDWSCSSLGCWTWTVWRLYEVVLEVGFWGGRMTGKRW